VNQNGIYVGMLVGFRSRGESEDMSETKVETGKCKCGEDIERRETVWHHVTGYKKGSMWCYSEEGKEGHAWPVPAVPAQVERDAMAEQVAPELAAEITICEHGWYKKDCPMCSPKAVPDKVAPQEPKCRHIWGWDRKCMACGEDSLTSAEPQAGAQPEYSIAEDYGFTRQDVDEIKAAERAGAQRKHAWKTGAAASDTYCLNCGVQGYMPMAAEECPNGALPTPKQAGAQVPSQDDPTRPAPMASRGLLDTTYTKRAEAYMNRLETRITELEAANKKLETQLHKHVAFRGL
jgi:hypothetical protein